MLVHLSQLVRRCALGCECCGFVDVNEGSGMYGSARVASKRVRDQMGGYFWPKADKMCQKKKSKNPAASHNAQTRMCDWLLGSLLASATRL
jgi:hypothetical protein